MERCLHVVGMDIVQKFRSFKFLKQISQCRFPCLIQPFEASRDVGNTEQIERAGEIMVEFQVLLPQCLFRLLALGDVLNECDQMEAVSLLIENARDSGLSPYQ